MCGDSIGSQLPKRAPALPPSACLEWLLASQGSPRAPCFTIDMQRLEHNLRLLAQVQTETGVKILLALKAFAAWPVFPQLSRALAGPLWGVCASSVDEARLGREDFRGEVHAFAAAWSQAEIDELLVTADYIVFNSWNQWRKYRRQCLEANTQARRLNPVRFGLRVNPEHSEGAAPIYNPCSPGSRLGIRRANMPEPQAMASLSGLHFHTLCEQDSPALAATLAAFAQKFSPWIKNAQWLNFGGGHHITRPGYNLDLLCQLLISWRARYGSQIYLEPGEAVALNAGWLNATVLDVVEADMPIAILDVSAACHMPDVLEMPYTPPLWYLNESQAVRAAQPGEAACAFRVAGKSCLAGDVIGEYSFKRSLKAGDRLVFGDMAIYSMVKTTTFNGLRLPDIALFDASSACPFTMFRRASYDDFRSRLG